MTTYSVGVAILDIIFENNHPTAANIGGSILNTVTTLTHIGHHANFVSSLANDEISGVFRKFMAEHHISTVNVSDDAQESMVALAFKAQST